MSCSYREVQNYNIVLKNSIFYLFQMHYQKPLRIRYFFKSKTRIEGYFSIFVLSKVFIFDITALVSRSLFLRIEHLCTLFSSFKVDSNYNRIFKPHEYIGRRHCHFNRHVKMISAKLECGWPVNPFLVPPMYLGHSCASHFKCL